MLNNVLPDSLAHTDSAVPKSHTSSPLLEALLDSASIPPESPLAAKIKKSLKFFLTEVRHEAKAGLPIETFIIDDLISNIDVRLTYQIEAILRDPKLSELESAWRSLRFLVHRTDFSENIKISFVNVSKDDLRVDFDDSIQVTTSGLYSIVYIKEYGQYGGQPYGAIIGNYGFSQDRTDIRLLQKIAAVAAMAHAPFIASAVPKFFGMRDFSEYSEPGDIPGLQEAPEFGAWNAFRQTEDSRYIGLTLPRFLLREPYSIDNTPVKRFNYSSVLPEGSAGHLWGSAAFAFATRLTESFTHHRWCAHIVGAQGGGTVSGLSEPFFHSLGRIQRKIPVEALISAEREYELSELGFIPLTLRKMTNDATFYSANSCQKTKFFGISEESRLAELNYKLGAFLPYLFIVCRLAHYIKIIQREHIGQWKDRNHFESELNRWLGQYISDMDNPSDEVRSRRPLRQAQLLIDYNEDDPKWARVNLNVTPHFKYMGASFMLSLTGRLDLD